MTKDEFLTALNSLAAYVESGIRDYISDNSIEDYLDVGQGMTDIQRLAAITDLRQFVLADDYPWLEQYQEGSIE